MASLAASRHSQLIAQHPALATHLRENLAKLDILRQAALSIRKEPEFVSLTALGVDSGDVLGDFRLVRAIGQGGMGIAYEAEQISLSRRVALKVLPLASVLDPRRLQRFQREAQAAATSQ